MKAGLGRVSTYIASGNVVVETDKSAAAVKRLLTDILRDRFGLTRNHALIRTPQSLAAVIAGNPFEAAAAERPNRLMVNFLDGLPPAGVADALRAYTRDRSSCGSRASISTSTMRRASLAQS